MPKTKMCLYCKHFHRHREIVNHFGDMMEVDSIGGDCRRHPPKPHWLTANAVWPFVTTGDSCSCFRSKTIKNEKENK